jgi:hypothetical protein
VTVKIGEEECYVLEATGFFGINPNDPTDNYFYVDVGPVTFQRVVDLFCVNLQLPSFLGNTGYPEGFQASYAAKPIFLPHAGISINQGFYFKGTLNIFGLTVESEIILDPPRLIDVYARLSPLTMGGGLLKMYESRDVTDRGPFLHVVVQSNPKKFTAEASGYVSVLGIEIEAMLSVSDSGYEISVYGNIFGVLEAELMIKASIGNVLDASYSVAGKISTTIQQDIQDAVVGLIDGAGEAANKAFSEAQATLDDAEDAFDDAVADLRAAERKVRNARNEVGSLRGEIRSWRDGLCEIKSCGDECVPFLCGCGCEVRVWGECVIPCLEFSSCCFKIPDPICLLENAGCYILRGAAEIAIAVAEVALLIAEGVLTAVEGVIHGLTVIVDNARFVLDVAKGIVTAVQATVAVGLAAFKAVTEFLLTGIINIKEIGFDVQLSAFSHGSISAYVEASFFRQDTVRVEVTLPLFNPFAIVSDLADRVIPGLGRKKRSSKSTDKILWLANHFRTHGTVYLSATTAN